MADTQDVFIEKLRQHNGRLEYFADKRWHAAQQRVENFLCVANSPCAKPSIALHMGRY